MYCRMLKAPISAAGVGRLCKQNMQFAAYIFIAFLQFFTAVNGGVPTCTQDGPLGMISGDIRDWQVTASSTFPAKWSRGCEERHARLYGPDGYSWCAQYKGTSEWLQIDLGVEATLTGVMTQGRGNNKDWVTAFAITYSLDASRWNPVLGEAGKQKIFDANVDSYSVKHNYLDQPVLARFVRLHPVRYHNHPSMRVELIGCQPCKQQLALPPYTRLTASSSRGRRAMRNCDASYGHTLSGKAWCARKLDNNQWLQVDLGPPARVTGLVIRGRGDGREDAWVTAFQIAYGSDDKSWALYKDADHLSPKVFGGNHDRDSERIHYLNRPFTARHVRFHPVTWHGGIAMRVGVIGCPQAASGSGGSGGGGACGDGSGGTGSGYFRFSNSSRCLANLAHDKPAWIASSSGSGGGGSSGRQHRKRQTADRGWDGWVETAGGGDACVALKPSAAAVGWLVDLKFRQPVQGVLLTANGTSSGGLDRVEVFVAKRSRRVFGGEGGRGGGDGGGDGISSQQAKCGSALNLSESRHDRPRSLHVACPKTMLGRFIYIEAHAAANGSGGGGGGVQRSAKSFLCDLRVY